jgi:hypothetical protein
LIVTAEEEEEPAETHTDVGKKRFWQRLSMDLCRLLVSVQILGTSVTAGSGTGKKDKFCEEILPNIEMTNLEIK